jgi:hypothetical protein
MHRSIFIALMALVLIGLSGPVFASESCNLAAFQVHGLSMDQQIANLGHQTDAIRTGQFTDATKSEMTQEFIKSSTAMQNALKKGCKRGDMLSLDKSEGWLVKPKFAFEKRVSC